MYIHIPRLVVWATPVSHGKKEATLDYKLSVLSCFYGVIYKQT